MCPKTNHFSQKLAQECNLQQLDHVPEWRIVGKRPKDFVNRLLVLDEEQRMTAKDAKDHWWFSNDSHKMDFEDVYHRATKHWRPRILKTPVIELIDADLLKDLLKDLPMVQRSCLLGRRRSRRRSLVPIDPPYKPYPRKMSLSLLPKRGPVMSGAMLTEMRVAIQEIWSPEKMRGQVSDADDEEVPALISDTGADGFDWQQEGDGRQGAPSDSSLNHQSRPCFMSPFKPPMQRRSVTVPERTLKVNTAFEVPSAKKITPTSVRSSGHRGAPSQERIDQADEHGQVEVAWAQTKVPDGIEGISSAVEAATIEDESRHAVSDTMSTGGFDNPRQIRDDGRSMKSPLLLADRSYEGALGIATEETAKVWFFGQEHMSPMRSPVEGPKFEVAVNANRLGTSSPEGQNLEAPTTSENPAAPDAEAATKHEKEAQIYL
jgi:hypothetical protein